jgi:regulator of RNase E activity RraA
MSAIATSLPRANAPLPANWNQLFTAVLSDALDAVGVTTQAMAPGIRPLDSKGRGQIQAVDVPVICGGVRVAPGDLVFGDADGVVVIPQEVEDRVLKAAFDKINGEHHSMRELRAGGYLRDVYAKYGVL